jgi:hypothetical protein
VQIYEKRMERDIVRLRRCEGWGEEGVVRLLEVGSVLGRGQGG